jgi:hypothetical protein
VDMIGEEREIEFPEFGTVHDVERFRDKTEQFLKAQIRFRHIIGL